MKKSTLRIESGGGAATQAAQETALNNFFGIEAMPSAVPLEEAVLGACMIDKAAWAIVSEVLNPDHFYEPRHQLIGQAMKELVEKHAPIDLLTVMEQLRSTGRLNQAGGPAYLAELTNRVASAANIEYHSRIIYQKALSREAIHVCLKSIVKLAKDQDDVFELRNNLSDELRTVPLQSFFQITTFSKSIQEGAKAPELKKMCGDLWHTTQVAFFFGPPGTGKSIMSIQIGDALSKGQDIIPGILVNECGPQSVLYVDFELTDRNLTNRYTNQDGEAYCFDDEKFIRARINPEFLNFDERLDKVAQDNLETLVLKYKPEVLIVDNITFLTAETASDTNIATKLMRRLMYYKRQYNLSLLIIAHSTKKFNPMIPIEATDMAGAAALMNFADSLFGIKTSAKDRGWKYLKQFKNRDVQPIYEADNVVVLNTTKGGAAGNMLMFEFARFDREVAHLSTPESDADAFAYTMKEACKLMIEKNISWRELPKALGVEDTYAWSTLRTKLINYAAGSTEFEYLDGRMKYKINEEAPF